MPEIGFGTAKVTETDGVSIISSAIQTGYRHIDTASFYGNEAAVGRAVAQSGLPRKEFFVTTKAWRTELGYDNVLRAFEASCKRLGMEQVDLYLLHWPKPSDDYEDWKALDRESWKAAEYIYEQGGARAIGVSNFLTHHLENLFVQANVCPMVNQIEFHPGYTQWDTVLFSQANNIRMQAWSPLGRQRMADDPLLRELAGKYGVSTSQICIKFALQCGVTPLPKSSNPQRMAENLAVDFTILPEDMERIHAMPLTGWSGEHPDRDRKK
jgi:diketogulonate reductase-like aldo/keto reductase